MQTKHLKSWLEAASKKAKEEAMAGEETMKGNTGGGGRRVYGAYIGGQLG